MKQIKFMGSFVLAFLLAGSIFPAEFLLAQAPSVTVKVATDKASYALGESVVIKVSAVNTSSKDVTLNFPSSKQVDYVIDGKFRSSSDKVFAQALTSVVIGPNGTKEWSFTHTALQYELGAGTHTIVGEVVGYGDATTSVLIESRSPILGEKFVVAVHPLNGDSTRMFIVTITDPTVIQQARNCYAYGLLNPLDPRCGPHITGQIASGNGGFNTNWNWHLIPSTVKFAGIGMEICDGLPYEVERDGVNFGAGTFCPWYSYILALGDQYPSLSSQVVRQTTTQPTPTTPATLVGTYIKVEANTLNVRQDATLTASKVGSAQMGAILKKLGEKNGWAKVQLTSGQVGWVFEKYVRPSTGPTVLTSGQKVIVTAGVLNVRSGPGIHNKIMIKVKQNNVFEKVEEKNGWIKIILSDGQNGWVSGAFVK